jgi:hypothetical protein
MYDEEGYMVFDDEGDADIDPVGQIGGKTTAARPGCTSTDDVLDGMAVYFDSKEVCGEAVNEKLATIVNNVGVNKMSETRMKEQLENIKRPENCKYLAVTKVNQEIWSKLSQPTRSCDVKFQKVQNALMKGISAVVQATHALYESLQKPDSTLDVRSVVKLLTEGSALILDANLELNFRRLQSVHTGIPEPRKLAKARGVEQAPRRGGTDKSHRQDN